MPDRVADMSSLFDRPDRYGLVTRVLHWGMAALFLAQFLSAATHWALPQENSFRDLLWIYHSDLGMTLFLLVLVRGTWGLASISRRPPHQGLVGQAAIIGNSAIYALMLIVPAVRVLAAWGGTRGLSYLSVPIFPARQTKIGWTQIAVEWHGEMGWLLGLLVLGHILMAVIWHRLIQRDGILKRMAG